MYIPKEYENTHYPAHIIYIHSQFISQYVNLRCLLPTFVTKLILDQFNTRIIMHVLTYCCTDFYNCSCGTYEVEY